MAKKRSYKGMTFPEGLKMSFGEFKKLHGSNHIFKAMHPKERDRELKKAHKIATDGNISRSSKKSRKSKATDDKSGAIQDASETGK